MEKSTGLVTALNPHPGYVTAAAAIAQEALATGKGAAELVIDTDCSPKRSSKTCSDRNAWQTH